MDCTVIIPTHDRLPLLSRCLDCLAAQDMPPDRFEVIVIDDGSTDGTCDVVAGRTDNVEVRLIRANERRGPAAARNHALRVARGAVALFIDDDALAPPWLVRVHVETHESDGRVFVDGPAVTVGGRTALAASRFSMAHVRLKARLDFFGRAFATVNASARLDDVNRCGGFDESLLAWEDVDLGRRLRALGVERRRNRRAYVLHWKPQCTSLADQLELAEERGLYAAAYLRRHPDAAARWQARVRYLRYDAALVRLRLAGRACPGARERPIAAFELIHAYAKGLRAGLRTRESACRVSQRF